MNHPISLKDNLCSLFLATSDQNAKISLMNAVDISTTDFFKSTLVRVATYVGCHKTFGRSCPFNTISALVVGIANRTTWRKKLEEDLN